MRYLTFISLTFLLIQKNVSSQKKYAFSGKLTYTYVPVDTQLRNILPARQTIIHANDSMIRIDNNTQDLGEQVLIKHCRMMKSYLLLETPIGRFALQKMEPPAHPDSTTYRWKRKPGKMTILNRKAKKIVVTHPDFPEPQTWWYFKDMKPYLLNSFEFFPGLPVVYTVPSEDGPLLYTLTGLETFQPDVNLFGVPSDYKKVSFDEFIKIMTEGE